MANWFSNSNQKTFKITIPRYNKNNYYAEYEISVQFFSNIKWTIYRRYSDFYQLFEELIKSDVKYKVTFPPKKTFNANSSSYLEHRRKSLEMYLNEIISISVNLLPRTLAYFLEMDKYEIHGLTTSLAKSYYKHGEEIIKQNRLFEVTLLTLHSINQRMLSPAPTNLYGKFEEDFGNVLELTDSLEKVRIVPNNLIFNTISSIEGSIFGTSNIQLNKLSFDISVFTNVRVMKIYSVNIKKLVNRYKIKAPIENLEVRHSIKSLNDMLFDEDVSDLEVEQLQKLVTPWKNVIRADFSFNSIAQIDRSIIVLSQVQILDLSHNQISEIDYLNYLVNLTHLNLSNNNLHLLIHNQSASDYSINSNRCYNLFTRLGQLKRLDISHNKLCDLSLVQKLYCLEQLDISHNLIREYRDCVYLVRLISLTNLTMTHNPVCQLPNFYWMIYELMLDRFTAVRINDLLFEQLPIHIQTQLFQYRTGNNTSWTQTESTHSAGEHLMILPMNIDDSSISQMQSLDNCNAQQKQLYDMCVYWLFRATCNKNGVAHTSTNQTQPQQLLLLPVKLLWCTELAVGNSSNNLLTHTQLVLLVACSNNCSAMLKCTLTNDNNQSNRMILRPIKFIDLANESIKSLMIGPMTNLMKFEFSTSFSSSSSTSSTSSLQNRRSMFLLLCRDAAQLRSFLAYLVNTDDESLLGKFGGMGKITLVNHEDYLECLKRFVDTWLWEMNNSQMGSIDFNLGDELQDLQLDFTCRAIFQMKSGSQLLLTVVIANGYLLLIDERLSDQSQQLSSTTTTIDQSSRSLPSSQQHRASSNFLSNNHGTLVGASGNCLSGGASSIGSGLYFEFIRIDAFNMRDRDGCYGCRRTELTVDANNLHLLCPVFAFPVELNVKSQCNLLRRKSFVTSRHSSPHMTIKLYLENEQLANQLRAIITANSYQESPADGLSSSPSSTESSSPQQPPPDLNHVLLRSTTSLTSTNTLTTCKTDTSVMPSNSNAASNENNDDDDDDDAMYCNATSRNISATSSVHLKRHDYLIRHLISSYSDLRLSISLTSPLLHRSIASLDMCDVIELCKRELKLRNSQSNLGATSTALDDVTTTGDIQTLFYTKFVWINFVNKELSNLGETNALVVITDTLIMTIYESNRYPSNRDLMHSVTMDSDSNHYHSNNSSSDGTCSNDSNDTILSLNRNNQPDESFSDPESDQPLPRRLVVNICARSDLIRVYAGLNNQCLCVCGRVGGYLATQNSEQWRAIWLLRNSSLARKVLFILQQHKHQSIAIQSTQEASISLDVELANEDGSAQELVYQIKAFSMVENLSLESNINNRGSYGSTQLVHYTSIEEIRLDNTNLMTCGEWSTNDTRSSSSTATAAKCAWSLAVVVTNVNISIVKHNISEYPVVIYGKDAVRHLPDYPQFQVLMRANLQDCMLIQLPGHDCTQLSLVVRNSTLVVSGSARANRSTSSTSGSTSTSNQKLHRGAIVCQLWTMFISNQKEQKSFIDKLRSQWSTVMQSDVPLRMCVC